MKLMYINGQFTKGNVTEEIEVTNPVEPSTCTGISIWGISLTGIRTGDKVSLRER